MNITEFSKLFRNVDRRYFFKDDDEVYFKYAGRMYDITSPIFWNNFMWVKYLNLPPEGMKMYNDVAIGFKENFLNEWRLKYKYDSEPDDFSWLNVEEVQKIGSNRVKREWGPIEWNYNSDPTPPKLVRNWDMRNKVNFENFRAYVSQDEYFMFSSKLPDFSSLAGIKDTTSYKVIDSEAVKSTYYRILKTMYVLSYLGGVSLKNLESENPLAKSLTHFYFYYYLRKTIDFPDLFKDYSSLALSDLEYHFHGYKRHWVWYHPHMKMDPSEFKRHDNDVVRNIHRVGKKVYYDLFVDLRTTIGTDYRTFLRKDSQGLTKTGQIIFQESTQVYVYCILAAQVKSRFKIVGDGAKSLQAQQIFQNQLIEERIVANNLTKLISDFRVAVKDSNVV